MKPKKVSARIRQICQVLETHGPVGNGQMHEHISDISLGNLSESCACAERLGLLSVEIARRKNKLGYLTQPAKIYSVVENWRAIIDSIDPPQRKEPSPWAFSCTPFQFGLSVPQPPEAAFPRLIHCEMDGA